ncbi:hypothetical protein OBBRIDRAFT_319013 [Obba rivulosa]|uniref:Uncharacterized protein n=1 Tax=Obba rivulosa TaxID=1052685 RepID=A0A8E2DPL2_9APHY|nr:hypothetical protein OBBRIDRAFT_319013 [Obba rivulosa]
MPLTPSLSCAFVHSSRGFPPAAMAFPLRCPRLHREREHPSIVLQLCREQLMQAVSHSRLSRQGAHDILLTALAAHNHHVGLIVSRVPRTIQHRINAGTIHSAQLPAPVRPAECCPALEVCRLPPMRRNRSTRLS